MEKKPDEPIISDKKTAKFFNCTLNRRIRELMSENKIRTEDLARGLSVSSEAVRLWSAGYARPDIDRLSEISDIFHVTSDYLLGLSNSRNENERIHFHNFLYLISDVVGTSNDKAELIKILENICRGYSILCPYDLELARTYTNIYSELTSYILRCNEDAELIINAIDDKRILEEKQKEVKEELDNRFSRYENAAIATVTAMVKSIHDTISEAINNEFKTLTSEEDSAFNRLAEKSKRLNDE